MFDYSDKLADSNHLVGSLIISMEIIAMSEVVRSLRFINFLFAGWLIVSIWILASQKAQLFGAKLLVQLFLLL